MLPHARDRRSSDSCSQTCSAPSDGCASSRSPSATSWRVRLMSSSRVIGARSSRGVAADHRLAVGPGAVRPRTRASVADRLAIEPGDRQHPGHARAQERLVGRRQVLAAGVWPPRGAARRSPPSPAATSASCRAGSRSRARAWPAPRPRRRRVADEEQVGARPLGQVVVDGQEQGVIGAGPTGLQPRVDVLRPGRRLERGKGILRIAPDPAGHEMQAVLQVPGRGGGRPATPG